MNPDDLCTGIILVVEDDPVCRSLAIMQLTRLGFTVHAACNGQECLELVVKTRYALILMDLQMPVMGGIDTTKAIRDLEHKARLPRVKIVALSANPERQVCLDSGMDDCIAKPASLDNLREVLRRQLSTSTGHLSPLTCRPEEEREAIKKRCAEIEERYKSIVLKEETSLAELRGLYKELIKLQERAEQLGPLSPQPKLEADKLKSDSADLSWLPSYLRQRRQAIKALAEELRKLHEEVTRQEEEWNLRRHSDETWITPLNVSGDGESGRPGPQC